MFKLVTTILLFCGSVFGQIEIAQSKTHNFYIYPDSIFRYDDKVLFTAKIRNNRIVRTDVILASCTRQTYTLVTSQITLGKTTSWVTPTTSKILIATKDSAMSIALDILCRIPADEQH